MSRSPFDPPTLTRRTRFRVAKRLTDEEQFEIQSYIGNTLKGVQDVDAGISGDETIIEMQIRTPGAGDFDMMVFRDEIGRVVDATVEISDDDLVEVN